MKHSKIHDKDQAEESLCEEEEEKHGSQERMQPAVNQPPAHRHLLNPQTLLQVRDGNIKSKGTMTGCRGRGHHNHLRYSLILKRKKTHMQKKMRKLTQTILKMTFQP